YTPVELRSYAESTHLDLRAHTHLIRGYKRSECGIFSGNDRIACRSINHYPPLRITLVVTYKECGKSLTNYGILLTEVIDAGQAFVQFFDLVVDIGECKSDIPLKRRS